MRLAQTPRLAGIHDVIQRRCDQQMFPAAADRAILSGLVGLLIMHWVACAWIVLNAMEGAQSTVISYVDALYWTVVTMASVGYGDIVPDTSVERVFAVFVILTGMAFYGYLIGNLAALLGSLDAARTRHLEQIEEILSWLRHRHVPERICKDVNDYFHVQWENHVALDDAEMLRRLPPSLQVEVAVCLNRQLLEKVEFLKQAPSELISALAMRLQQKLFRPGDIIFRSGNIGDSMYFISRGTVEIVAADGIDVIARLSDGQFFGEMALLSGGQRSASARATAYSVLAVLEKNCFDKTLEHFPDMKKAIEGTARIRREQSILRSILPVSGDPS
jgi:voltage-gated potassium channel